MPCAQRCRTTGSCRPTIRVLGNTASAMVAASALVSLEMRRRDLVSPRPARPSQEVCSERASRGKHKAVKHGCRLTLTTSKLKRRSTTTTTNKKEECQQQVGNGAPVEQAGH